MGAEVQRKKIEADYEGLDVHQQLRAARDSFEALKKDLSDHLHTPEDLRLTELNNLMKRSVQMEYCHSYLKCVDHIERVR